MKQMPYEPGTGRSTAPGAPDITFHYERLASDPAAPGPVSFTIRVVPREMKISCSHYIEWGTYICAWSYCQACHQGERSHYVCLPTLLHCCDAAARQQAEA